MKEVYSPAPIDSYIIPNSKLCEVREIMNMKGHLPIAVWNLFWLSNPAIDAMPELGIEWWKSYRPTRGLAKSVVMDVMEDEALFRKLLMTPDRFIEFFEREDVTIYHTYEVLGEAWHPMVLQRARSAASFMKRGTPNIKHAGNVVYLNWSKEKV